MNVRIIKAMAVAAVAAVAIGVATSASAGQPFLWVHASHLPWHNAYVDPAFGQPVALVVPPTAEHQTQWGWGVGSFRTTQIYHQFGRSYPGDCAGGPNRGFKPMPNWPADTTQFGVYYVRGPW